MELINPLLKTWQALAVMPALVLFLAACSGVPDKPGIPASSGTAKQQPETQQVVGHWPAGMHEMPTTRGEIYLANLNSQVRVLELRSSSARDITARVSLAGLLYHRFQLLGRIEDAEQARNLMQDAMEQNLLDSAGLLAYARILSGLHEFDAAQEVIERAAQRGGKEPAVTKARAELRQARKLPSPILLPVNGQETSGNYVEAVQQAARLLEQGEPEAASRLLRSAQDSYRDSSPFPLAWIHLQQGVAHLRYHQYEQARIFFAAAHERLPQYYLATEHLAETEALLGNWQRSAELYRQVSLQTDQPDFWHGLHQAEAELGHAVEAEQAGRIADHNYRQLLDHYPLTFADHAVGYFIDTGREKTALQLAELNFANRQDVYAHLTLAEALDANGRSREACEQVDALREAGLAPPEITLPGENLADCPASR